MNLLRKRSNATSNLPTIGEMDEQLQPLDSRNFKVHQKLIVVLKETSIEILVPLETFQLNRTIILFFIRFIST
jgi:hypothetical protein